jgi:hypothetical protein
MLLKCGLSYLKVIGGLQRLLVLMVLPSAREFEPKSGSSMDD